MGLVLLVTSVLFTLGLAEMAFRVYKSSQDGSFRLAESVYGQFDARFGHRFVPNSKNVLSVVTNRRVVWCGGIVASANADGLGGRRTLADARAAEYVIFTTGDSVSHWKRSDLTVPDMVESLLSDRTGIKVVNLNFARGGYGVLQMLTIAAEMYPVVKPNLIVIQFISDDLTRGRWWTREALIDGRKRAQMSSRPNGFDDLRITNDEVVVDGRATEEWCQRQLVASSQDSVVRDATAYYHDYLRAKGIAFRPFALTKFYLAESLWMKFFGRPFHAEAVFSLIPRVTAEEFAADPDYRDAVGKLKRFGVPVVLVHLPSKAEIVAGGPFRGREMGRIWTHLEDDLDTRVVTLAALPNRPATPQTIDLQPHDGHPNLDGIKFYGEYVARAIEARVRLQRAVPALGHLKRRDPAGLSRKN
jgi:hypothetical protein